MKTIKYLFIGMLATVVSVPALAQLDDHSAVISQISKVIKDKGANVEAEVKSVVKANKKNADVLTAIGRAYLEVKDLDNAKKYADMAIARNKQYGAAYVLLGDIEVLKDDGGAASSWFQQAIYFDPKNPDGYVRYAQTNQKASLPNAISKLEDLRAQVPSYPVDALCGDLYQGAGNIKKALESYAKADKSKLEASQLVNYAMDYYLTGDFNKSLEVSTFGNQKFPRNAALNRISFWDYTNLKDYEKALSFADRLFTQSDSAKITSKDYLHQGYVYLGLEDYAKAIETFGKAYDEGEEYVDDRLDALKNISTAYQKQGDIENAVGTYDKYLKTKPEITAADMGALATMWQNHAKTLTGDEKAAAQLKADAVWAEIAEKFPSVAHVAYNNRARIAVSLDPESTQGLAKPHYEKVAELLADKPDRAANETKYLIDAYHYLGAYYTIVANEKEQGDYYWNKMLELDPENKTAKIALGLIKPE